MSAHISSLAIATISWARDEEESSLLIASITELAALKLPIFITDGGSIASFISFLNNQAFYQPSSPVQGVWQQAKSSLLKAYASGASHILYTEPDKLGFFRRLHLMLGDNFSLENDTTILFSRTAKAFATFPAFQQMTETTINNCCATLIKTQADYTYGPFIISRNIIPHLLQLPENIDWGWRPFAFNVSCRLGCKLMCVEGDFDCPDEQRLDSAPERIYRMKQLYQNIQGLVLSTTASL